MKKAVFAAAAALLLMTLCSCAKAPVKAPLPSGSAAYTSDPIGTQAPHTEEAVLPTVTAEGNTATPYTPLPTPSVYPDFGYKNYNTGKIVSTEGGSVYYMREKIMLSEAYPNATVKKYRPMEADSQGVPLYFTIIDNDLIGYFNIDSEGTVEGEIGSVDIATGKREHLITLPLNSQAAITLVTDKYIFWEESYDNSNWYKTRIHLYERGSKTDKIIYTHTQNPETGFKYQWNWSRPVLLDGKLYFDDVIGMVNHETSEAAVNLYCYDISSGKLKLFAEKSKNPKAYGDGFAWAKKEALRQILI